MEPWRAVDARNGDMENQTGAMEDLQTRNHFDEDQDRYTDPHQSEKRPEASDANP